MLVGNEFEDELIRSLLTEIKALTIEENLQEAIDNKNCVQYEVGVEEDKYLVQVVPTETDVRILLKSNNENKNKSKKKVAQALTLLKFNLIKQVVLKYQADDKKLFSTLLRYEESIALRNVEPVVEDTKHQNIIVN